MTRGALLDELIKLRLLVVETRDVATLLVPAESAGAEVSRTSLSAKT
jgi:hypothetical protein